MCSLTLRHNYSFSGCSHGMAWHVMHIFWFMACRTFPRPCCCSSEILCRNVASEMSRCESFLLTASQTFESWLVLCVCVSCLRVLLLPEEILRHNVACETSRCERYLFTTPQTFPSRLVCCSLCVTSIYPRATLPEESLRGRTEASSRSRPSSRACCRSQAPPCGFTPEAASSGLTFPER